MNMNNAFIYQNILYNRQSSTTKAQAELDPKTKIQYCYYRVDIATDL